MTVHIKVIEARVAFRAVAIDDQTLDVQDFAIDPVSIPGNQIATMFAPQWEAALSLLQQKINTAPDASNVDSGPVAEPMVPGGTPPTIPS